MKLLNQNGPSNFECCKSMVPAPPFKFGDVVIGSNFQNLLTEPPSSNWVFINYNKETW